MSTHIAVEHAVDDEVSISSLFIDCVLLSARIFCVQRHALLFVVEMVFAHHSVCDYVAQSLVIGKLWRRALPSLNGMDTECISMQIRCSRLSEEIWFRSGCGAEWLSSTTKMC